MPHRNAAPSCGEKSLKHATTPRAVTNESVDAGDQAIALLDGNESDSDPVWSKQTNQHAGFETEKGAGNYES